MLIRKFDKEDKKQVLALIGKILFEIFRVKPKKLELDKGLFKKDAILYVAEDTGKIIGTIGIKKYKKDIARLKKMYLEKFYRGKGVSQKLFEKAQAFAKKSGYKKIILSTTPQMKGAIKFYEKNGFIKYRVNKRKNQIFFYKNL